MTELDLLALDLAVSGRTLRRAFNRGAIHAPRAGGRRIRIPAAEAEYLRQHWPILSALTAALRTLPAVRLAILFGSGARGTLRAQSDLDLLVRLAQSDLASRALLSERLEEASGRMVQLVELTEAVKAPLLLADVLRDGRVLVDRDDDWPKLKRRERAVRRQAEQAQAQLDQDVWDDLRELGVVA